MEHTPKKNIGVLAAVAAALLVLVFLFAIFVMSSSTGNRNGITLPEPSHGASSPQTPEQTPSGSFAEISAENVLDVLKTIYRADAYYQTYQVSVGAEELLSSRYMELWVSGDMLHGEVYDGVYTKSVLTDGTSIYLWYQNDEEPAFLQRTADVTIEDMLGLLTYEHLLDHDPKQITHAEYMVLESSQQVPCIYVECRETEELTSRYWIDLQSGLLYKAELLKQDQQVYLLQQQTLSVLVTGDAVFAQRFRLPDGTSPFTEETETPQP